MMRLALLAALALYLVALAGCASDLQRAFAMPNGISACLVFGEGSCTVRVPSTPLPLPLPLPAQGHPQ